MKTSEHVKQIFDLLNLRHEFSKGFRKRHQTTTNLRRNTNIFIPQFVFPPISKCTDSLIIPFFENFVDFHRIYHFIGDRMFQSLKHSQTKLLLFPVYISFAL